MTILHKIGLFITCQLLFVSNVVSEDKRDKEGLWEGYLADCPGSTKEARIANASLKHLQIAVLGHGNFITAKKTIYNYHEMKELAANTNFNEKIFMYMPGYVDHISLPLSSLMGLQYKKLGYNVWILEYSRFSLWPYPIAARFLRTVGQRVAEMLATLTKFGLNPKNLHLAGVSLGGQGISFIAKNYRRLTGMNISHITSLDPSGPCFRNLGPDQRLDMSDADFVEVVHTNIKVYGMVDRMGQVDFYVNGGDFQPADIPTYPCVGLCSHAKSFLYWITALNNPKCFIAMQCDTIQDARSWNCYDRKPLVTNYLGEFVNKSTHGIFLLSTTYGYPYCMGEKGLNKGNNFKELVISNLNSKDLLVI